MINIISKLLKLCESESTVMPPTVLYNEGWMLRIVLDWFAQQVPNNHPLSFSKDARWYSEILLPSPFLPRFRKDRLAESYTHADGAIGHFTIGRSGKGDINLSPTAKQLVIIEAKMFSRLSGGITNFKNYDQATRNVACMAEVLNKSHISIEDIPVIGFYVIAPEKQLEHEPTFNTYLSKSNIQNKVYERVQAYKGEKEEDQKCNWYEGQFLPLIEKIDVNSLSWEQIIEHIISNDSEFGFQCRDFYKKCIEYN